MSKSDIRSQRLNAQRERDLVPADTARFREHVRRRMVGLTKAVDDYEPGAREFCLGAIADVSDYVGVLRDLLAERDAQVAVLRGALERIVRAEEEAPVGMSNPAATARAALAEPPAPTEPSDG